MTNYPNYGVPNTGALLFGPDSSFCMELSGGNSQNGGKIDLWKCNGLVNQAWYWKDYKIQLAGANKPGKCIDLPGGKTFNGNKLQLWECIGTDSQKWSLDGQFIKYTAN